MSSKHRRHETEFMRMFRSLTYRRAAQEVWNDLIQMFAGDVEKQLEKQGYITICDPCCGAGGMLIAAVNSVKKKLRSTKWNAQDCMLMIGQDIDEIAALMCYIQLSLFGMAGYVKVGNALTEPISEHDTMDQYWFTPMYFSDVWVIHRQKERTEQYLKGDVENGM